MRIGIATWNERVSPVLDVARELTLVDVENRRMTRRGTHLLSTADPYLRAREMAAMDIDVVICGAVSGMLEHALASAGIEVICWVSGAVEEVLAAFINGVPIQDRFAMPGCRGCGMGKRKRYRFGARHRGGNRR